MPLLGSGMLANWGGVTAEAEADYNAWHSLEHLPERLRVPGFRRGRRCQAVAGTDPRLAYFMAYEVEAPSVLTAPPYLARLNDPTAWTRRILQAYVAPCRTVCTVLASRGLGVGGWLGTVQVAPTGARDAARALATGPWLDAVMALPGIIGAHAVEGDETLGQQPTAEKRFRESRGEPDRTVAFALLIDGLDEATTATALAMAAGMAEAAGAVTATLYRTQHVLTREDVA
jgi:hypothetical protein